MKTSVEIKVRGYHVDHFGHVNNARYLEFLEEARWDYFDKNDLIDEFHDRGYIHVSVNININYRKSAYPGQVLKIDTEVSGVSSKTIIMNQHVYDKDTGILITDAFVTNVFLEAKGFSIQQIDDFFRGFWLDLANF